MKIFNIVLIVAICLIPSLVSAETTICKAIDSKALFIRGVAWDTEKMTAKLSTTTGKTIVGQITSIRNHDKGIKVNIVSTQKGAIIGTDLTEWVIFTFGNTHKIIGVGYIVREGKQLLDIFLGNEEINCLTL